MPNRLLFWLQISMNLSHTFLTKQKYKKEVKKGNIKYDKY
jgi:hypothetical protein